MFKLFQEAYWKNKKLNQQRNKIAIRYQVTSSLNHEKTKINLKRK